MGTTHYIGLTLFAVACVAAFAQEENTGKGKVLREGTEWCDAWLPNATKTDLPYALLVGDSITRGYYSEVEKALAGKVNCGRLSTSACVADPSFPCQLEGFLTGYKHAVIHFNNGLHGFGYTEEEYRAGLQNALEIVKKLQPEAKIIIALTTPLRPGSPQETLTPRVEARNAIAKEWAAKFGAALDDLFSVSKGRAELYSDPYHYKPEGVKLQAEKVTEAILKVLGK